jgi:hypothetical protein
MASIDKRLDGQWRARWREFPGGPQRSKAFRPQGRHRAAPREGAARFDDRHLCRPGESSNNCRGVLPIVGGSAAVATRNKVGGQNDLCRARPSRSLVIGLWDRFGEAMLNRGPPGWTCHRVAPAWLSSISVRCSSRPSPMG